jgi:PAS domain S-box-containing protein
VTPSIKNTTLGLWLALILLLIICGVSIMTLNSSNAAAKIQRDSAALLFDLEDILDHLQDAEAGQRGYILTDKKDYLAPYAKSMQTFDQVMAKSRAQFGQLHPQSQHSFAEIEALVEKKRVEMDETIKTYEKDGKDKALWIIRGDAGKKTMDEIREKADTLRKTLQQEREAAIRRAQEVRHFAFSTIIGGSAVLFLIVASSTAVIGRGIRRQEDLLEQRRISEENLSVTLASIGDGLIATDQDSRVTMLNHVTAKLTGWSEEEARGKPIEEVFRIINESTREKVLNPAEQAVRENRIVELANHTKLIHRNGSEIFIDDSAAPIRDSSGKVRGAILVFRDVTVRKQAQKAQAALNVRLRRAMAETHHRVKNNLQVIASLVDMQLVDGTPTVSAEALQRVKQHVVALATIHDLLTQEAKQSGDADSLQTRDVLEKLRPLLNDLVGTRKLNFNIADLRLPIRQGTSLAVLINEIVSNSVKHGSGDIDIILSQPDALHGQLEVRDYGDGFPANFNPRQAANTGLELIDSLGRWDLHGTIRFQNHPDGGAQVIVTFPLDTPRATAEER